MAKAEKIRTEYELQLTLSRRETEHLIAVVGSQLASVLNTEIYEALLAAEQQ